MFEFNQKKLLNILITSDAPIKIDDLQAAMKLKKRAIYNLINKVNEELSFYKLSSIQNIRSKGYLLDEEEKKKINSILERENNAEFLRPTDRVNYLISWLTYPQSVVHVNDIMQVFDISRNSVFNDLNAVKKVIEKYKLTLEFDNKQGYYIQGKGMTVRSLLLYHLNQLINAIGINRLHFIDEEKVNEYCRRLEKVAMESGTQINSAKFFAYGVLLEKVKDIGEKFDFSILELKELTNSKELECIDKYFQDFKVHERLYLAIQMLESRASSLIKLENEESDIALLKLAHTVVETFENLSLVYLDKRASLINSLYIHFKLSKYYHKLNIEVNNPLIDDVKENYANLFNIIKMICEQMDSEFPFPLTDGELTYITMHFGGYIKSRKSKIFRKIKVIVVCPSGISTSTLLKREIQNIYSNVEVIDCTTVENIDRYHDINFIVSTVNIQSNIPWIKVHTILNQDDKNRIASMVLQHYGVYDLNVNNVDSFYDQLKTFIIPEKMEAFKKFYFHYLQEGQTLVDGHEEDEKSLYQLLDTNNIIFNTDSKLNWRDAIRKSAKPLLDMEIITANYVDKMIETLEMNGFYILLKNHVAIAHAKPEDGAMKIGLSILISDTPIFFHQNEVYFLFTVSIPEYHSQERLLKDIMVFAESAFMLKQIRRQKSAENVLQIIENAFV